MGRKLTLAIIIVVLVTLVISFLTIKHKVDKEKEQQLFIKPIRTTYTKTLTDIPGFPFKVECKAGEVATVSLTDGVLIETDNIKELQNKKYEVTCNSIVYWYPEVKTDRITLLFEFKDLEPVKYSLFLLGSENIWFLETKN